MKRYSIVCICQIYNEIEKGNLYRFVKYIKPLVDAIVVYDDGSTDGSFEYMLEHAERVIRGEKNDFINEGSHKEILLEEALKLSPDFILWLDADEVLTANAAEKLQGICQYCIENQIDAISLHEINLWRSSSWKRIDNLYDDGWFVRLWRADRALTFGEPSAGLHRVQYPSALERIEKNHEVQVIHYGFSTRKSLANKYLIYKKHGQRGYQLDRLISEEGLKTEKVSMGLFPEGIWIDDEKLEPLALEESYAYLEEYREEIFQPKFSIICLIYKSVDWLKFVHQQVLKYTDLRDKEFFFVANDANDAVKKYLAENFIQHYTFENSPEQREEWFINNVYRAWNFGARMAKGDFLVFINSDMGLTPSWLDNLWKAYNGSNCVVSRLVESGKLKSGKFGIEKNFGLDHKSFKESKFQNFKEEILENKVQDGGLFMPLLIRKKDFMAVGGYPEGNIINGSNIFNPVIAKRGEPCLSGDHVLMQKLSKRGIRHQTAFDSIIYHFQCGEMDSAETKRELKKSPKVAICNDTIKGSMGEKVLWEYLVESLPAAVGIGREEVGEKGDYASTARSYIKKHYPGVKVIIQNGTFIGTVYPSIYTVVFLQDNLRAMGRASWQQEINLLSARKIVTNSINTALMYQEFKFENKLFEYDFNIIPIGIDHELFKPLDKNKIRAELGYKKDDRIGIFVGDFSEIKGWEKVKECINSYTNFKWILVSKKNEDYVAPNVKIYNKIPQDFLVKLLNCADFFILGSPVETQCLAALEACFCNVPIIMRNVGIFTGFTEEERSRAGIFGEDFIGAIEKLRQGSFTPRQVVLEKKLTIEDCVGKWKKLLEQVFLEIAIEEATAEKESNRSRRHEFQLEFFKFYVKGKVPSFLLPTARLGWQLLMQLIGQKEKRQKKL